jgi:hypothetical protein
LSSSTGSIIDVTIDFTLPGLDALFPPVTVVGASAGTLFYLPLDGFGGNLPVVTLNGI